MPQTVDRERLFERVQQYESELEDDEEAKRRAVEETLGE